MNSKLSPFAVKENESTRSTPYISREKIKTRWVKIKEREMEKGGAEHTGLSVNTGEFKTCATVNHYRFICQFIRQVYFFAYFWVLSLKSTLWYQKSVEDYPAFFPPSMKMKFLNRTRNIKRHTESFSNHILAQSIQTEFNQVLLRNSLPVWVHICTWK